MGRNYPNGKKSNESKDSKEKQWKYDGTYPKLKIFNRTVMTELEAEPDTKASPSFSSFGATSDNDNCNGEPSYKRLSKITKQHVSMTSWKFFFMASWKNVFS